MKRIQAFVVPMMLAFGAALLYSSCAPSIRMTTSWVNQENPVREAHKSVFLMVLTDNLEMRSLLENNLYNAATANGIKAYKSLDVLGPISGLQKDMIKDEVVLNKIKEKGSETVFTVALVDEKSETRYVPGSTVVFAPYPHYGYYGRFNDYYNYSSVTYTRGYFKSDKTYFIESNLYDVATQNILLSIQSRAENPSAIKKESKAYTKLLVKELKQLGMLKK